MYIQLDRARDLSSALAYHEHKTNLGYAELIHATNFFRDPEMLTEAHITRRFKDLLSLNQRCVKKLLHYSVSFYPEDKPRLTNAVLRDISEAVMQRLGLDEQPCLVYRHHDAPHPHIHILGPIIARDGHVITCDQAVKDGRLRQLTREVEARYMLQPPHLLRPEYDPEEALHRPPQKVIYQARPMAAAIGGVLEFLQAHYHYTSLDAFNSLLREYNIRASPVDRQKRRSGHQGLVYYLLDNHGKRVSPTLKASLFRCGATLSRLEPHFKAHEAAQTRAAPVTEARILRRANEAHDTPVDFFDALQGDQIATLIDHDAGGRISRFMYVDHQSRCVYGEEELSKACSAAVILARYKLPDQKLIPPGNSLPSAGIPRQRMMRSVAADLAGDSPLAYLFTAQRLLSPDDELTQKVSQVRNQMHMPMSW